MKIKINTIKTVLFYISILLLSFSRVFVKAKALSLFLDISSWVSVIICVMILFLNRSFKKSDLLLVGAFLAVGIINAISISDFELLRIGLIIAASHKQSFKKYIKYDLCLKILIVIVAYMFYKIGIADDIRIYEDGIYKHSYGFAHPNMLAAYIFMISAEIFYVIRSIGIEKKMQIFAHLASCVLSMAIIVFVCGSRTCALLSIILLIFGLVQIVGLKLDILLRSAKYLFIILTTASVVLSFMYSAQIAFAVQINELLTGRLMWASDYIGYYGFSISGKAIAIYDHVVYQGGIAFMCIDNAYIYTLLKFGIMAWFIFAMLFKRIASDKNNDSVRLIMIVLLLFGFTEASIIKPQINPFLLAKERENDE